MLPAGPPSASSKEKGHFLASPALPLRAPSRRPQPVRFLSALGGDEAASMARQDPGAPPRLGAEVKGAGCSAGGLCCQPSHWGAAVCSARGRGRGRSPEMACPAPGTPHPREPPLAYL